MSPNSLLPDAPAHADRLAIPERLSTTEYGSELSGTDDAGLWALLRRKAWLIGACTALAIVTSIVVTMRMPKVFEASASVQIDERPSRFSSINGPEQPGGNTVATELELLRSHLLAEAVAESLQYRLRVLEPSSVPRSELFAKVTIRSDARPGVRRLVLVSRDRYALPDAGDNALIGVTPGVPIEMDGVVLDVAPTALPHKSITFELLAPDVTSRELNRAITIARRNRDASIVDVRVRDANPTLARDMANAIVRQFINGRQGARQLEAAGTVAFLRKQSARVAAQLNSAEQALRAFRERNSIVNLPTEASTGVARRAALMAQRDALHTERQALLGVLGSPGADSPERPPASYRDLLAFPTLLQNGQAANLVAAMSVAEERRSELLGRRTTRDPQVERADARIAELQGQMQSLVQTYLAGLTNQASAVDTLLKDSRAQLAQIPAKEIRLAGLERTAHAAEATYSMLQTHLKDAEIAAAATDRSVRPVDPAVVPRRPVAPRPLANVAFALVGGAMLGLAGALLLEHSDKSLRTRRQLLLATGVPVLGIVPRLALKRRWTAQMTRVGSHVGLARSSALEAPEVWDAIKGIARGRPGQVASASRYDEVSLSVFEEAHARLVTNVAFMSPTRKPSVLLIMSALQGDGKTTVASNLAVALARTGQRVLLIDSDLRGGRVSGLLGLPPRQPGLAEVLSGRAALSAQLICQMPVGRGDAVSAIVAGHAGTARPAQLLGSPRMRELFEWAKTNFDSIVVDTPAMASVADAAVLAPLADGVVLVARAGSTERGALQFVMEQLRIVRAPIVGAVLNDVELGHDASYDAVYRHYRTYEAATA